MTRRWAMVIAAVLLVVLGSPVNAAPRSWIVIETTETVGLTTTVTRIDYANRTITLAGPQGGEATFHVGPQVRNFDDVHPGDTIAASYLLQETIAVFPRGVRGPRPPLGPRPDSAVADTTKFTATVVGIDRTARVVWLRGPAGVVARVTISPDAPNFDRLRRGDKVAYRAAATLTTLASGPLPQTVKAGILNCERSSNVGLIVGSHQTLACRFVPDAGGPGENYGGSINRVGLDIGATAGGRLAWAVYAPTTNPQRGSLAGSYGGATGEASVGVGVGANFLLGGSGNTVALQPLSIEGQVGFNLALGITNLQLWPSP